MKEVEHQKKGVKWKQFVWSHKMIVFGSEIEICSPVDREGATSEIVVADWLEGCKCEAGESSGEAVLTGILKGEGIGEGEVTANWMGAFSQSL